MRPPPKNTFSKSHFDRLSRCGSASKGPAAGILCVYTRERERKKYDKRGGRAKAGRQVSAVDVGGGERARAGFIREPRDPFFYFSPRVRAPCFCEGRAPRERERRQRRKRRILRAGKNAEKTYITFRGPRERERDGRVPPLRLSNLGK